MRATTSTHDVRWAAAMTAGGMATMLFALRAHWVPGDLDPGIEGCLTVTLVGFVMALLHGLPYRQALALCAVPVMAQYLLCAHAAGPAISAGITGMTLAIMGLVGLVTALGQPRAEPEEPVRTIVTEAHRTAGAHS
jgi:hypothetical protein